MNDKNIWTWRVKRETILSDFAEAVKKEAYKKIEYRQWRELAANKGAYINITMSPDAHAHNLSYELETVGVGGGKYYAKSNDKSFGSFIALHWQNAKYTYTMNDHLTTQINDIKSGLSTINFIPDSISSSAINLPDYSMQIQDLFDKYSNQKENKNTKENKKMDTSNLFNFDFGPASGNNFRMSPYGLAVRTQTNGWIAYNPKTGDLMDVDVLNFDISKMIYKMPVALSAIKPGDILMHGGKPVFVRDIGTGTLAGPTVNVIDYATASVMDILPVKSPFGFNFFTKITPLFDMSGLNANPDNPFGNMLPFLMLQGEDNDFDPTLLFLAGGMGNMDFTSNPMMLYFLMNRKDKSDLLPFLMMMNGGIPGWGNGAQATTSAPAMDTK